MSIIGDQELSALFDKICAEWDEAERDIKRAEQVSKTVVIPAITELRYAGRRIIQAIQGISADSEREKIKTLLHDAWFDCHRARHDAIDAATSQIAEILNVAARKLGYDPMLQAYKELPALHSALSKIRKKIVQSRGDAERRDDLYGEIELSDFPKLVDMYEDFLASEPMMIAFAKKERRRRIHSYAALGVAICLLVVALVAHHAALAKVF